MVCLMEPRNRDRVIGGAICLVFALLVVWMAGDLSHTRGREDPLAPCLIGLIKK